MKREEAFGRAVTLILVHGPAGRVESAADMLRQVDSALGIACRWTVARATAATLSVSTVPVGDTMRIMVGVGWTSDALAPAAARAAVRLHADVVDLACLLEVELGDVELDWRAP